LIFPRNILRTMYLFDYPSTREVSKYQAYIGPFKILYFFPFYFLSAIVYLSSYCDVSLMSIETVVLNWKEKCISAWLLKMALLPFFCLLCIWTCSRPFIVIATSSIPNTHK
jgi:hypothetical protein